MKTSYWKPLLATAILAQGCGSTPKSSVDVPVSDMEIDYVVRERNPNPAPEWVKDVTKFKNENNGRGKQLFHGESGDVSDRSTGCDLAELDGKRRIASQIATMITNNIASSKAGKILINKDNPDDPDLRSHFESTIAAKSMAFLSGVRTDGLYWEERDYSKTGGRKRVYLCNALVSINDLDFQKAVRRSADRAPEAIDDPDAKAAAKEALKSVDAEFKAQVSKKN
jgi:hypothetical protein